MMSKKEEVTFYNVFIWACDKSLNNTFYRVEIDRCRSKQQVSKDG